MKHFWLWLTPEQPLALPDATGATSRAIRGMVAAAALRTCLPDALHEDGPCSPGCLYWPLFSPRSGLRVGPGYAAATKDPVTRFAQTAYTCRDFPGFAAEGGHGVVDCAIREFVFDESRAAHRTILAPFEQRCPVCGAPQVHAEGGFVNVAAGTAAAKSAATASPDHRFRAVAPGVLRHSAEHRSIDPLRGRAGSPFQQVGFVFPDGAGLGVSVAVPDALETPLRTALFRELYLGGRRTRGMGRVRAELIALPDPTVTLRERIAAFNRAVRVERRFYAAMNGDHQPADDDGTWYFTLDYPEGIAAENATLLDPLAEVRQLAGVLTIRRWARPGAAGGWSMAAGLPARSQVTQHGAILCAVAPEQDRSQVEQALAYLEVYGLGVGREYGLGQVMVCAPFHLEVAPI
jgi:CRISPR-associated protein Csx10